MSVKNENTVYGKSVMLELPAANWIYAPLFEKINLGSASVLSVLNSEA